MPASSYSVRTNAPGSIGTAAVSSFGTLLGSLALLLPPSAMLGLLGR
jgi:hypothetical protein